MKQMSLIFASLAEAWYRFAVGSHSVVERHKSFNGHVSLRDSMMESTNRQNDDEIRPKQEHPSSTERRDGIYLTPLEGAPSIT